MADSFPAKVWDEDQLLAHNPDGNGHAANIFAPGGWIGRFKPDGTSLQLVSMGQRNTYDVAFHQSGELFSYDADMEWDFGMPWYRPTRINHVVPGGEMGWRNGTGKWPEYYEDSMAPSLNIGPGSPVGLLSGKGFKAPAKYQHAIYAFDWTFATIYAVHLTPNGASFDAAKEEFFAGAGLPLTNGIITTDGTMYFATGGRRTSSALWRVTYTGAEPTAPTPGKFAASPSRDKLAGYTINPTTAKVEEIWELLGSEERTIRFMAKAALERLPDTSWAVKLKTEQNVSRIIAASMGLSPVLTRRRTVILFSARCIASNGQSSPRIRSSTGSARRVSFSSAAVNPMMPRRPRCSPRSTPLTLRMNVS